MKSLLALVAAWCCTLAAAQQPVEPLPVDAFFGRVALEGARLSPSGRHLAVLVPRPGGHNMLVAFELGGEAKPKVLAGFVDADIAQVHWLGEDRLVFEVFERDVADGERRGNFPLFSIRRDGTEQRQIVRFRDEFITTASNVTDRRLSSLHEMVDVPDSGEEIVVAEWRYSNDERWQQVALKRVNVRDGRATSLSLGLPSPFSGVLFDGTGQPRLVTTQQKGRVLVHWRDNADSPWRQIAELDAVRPAWWPRQLTGDGSLYVTRSGGPAGETQLVRFDFARGQPEKDALVSTPGFDFRGEIVTETDAGPALGVRTVTDAETTVWFDPALKAAQQDIDARLPGRVNRLACRRCGTPQMTVLVHSWSDREPGEYWLWQPAGDGKPAALQPVGRTRPAIDPRRMGRLDLHRIRARDGRDLPVWVTQPAGAKPGEQRPAVVVVHGGPWLRGVTWGWNPWAQFLASRGYVVIEPEFRGSTGYGAAHYEAGIKQWGLAMQDDVADATRWAQQHAGVDARRVCIVGASYGGYSALMGLVRDGELYRCGVAWAAVTEPRLRFRWSFDSDGSDELRNYTLPALLGDPVADAARFDATSPLVQAERIRAPLLLAFGDADRRVPIENGTLLRRALERAGRPPEWLVYVGEGHGWRKPENQFDFARRVERFLGEHTRPQP